MRSQRRSRRRRYDASGSMLVVRPVIVVVESRTSMMAAKMVVKEKSLKRVRSGIAMNVRIGVMTLQPSGGVFTFFSLPQATSRTA